MNYLLYTRILCLFLGILVVGVACNSPKTAFIDDSISFAEGQLYTVSNHKIPADRIPRTLNNEGKLVSTNIYNWTSGFFPGNLWLMYKLTGDSIWSKQAKKWTEKLAPIQHWSGHHDVGFMINCSYGQGFHIGGQESYRQVVINAANSLSKRYDERVKAIESWDYRKAWDGVTEWHYPVIIDNMMNLELLFEAHQLSGNERFKDIAVNHANTTLKHHYREDYSCYHVVDYDTISGVPLDKATCQGFTDDSAWSRGQAWGLYGYTMCYRYVKDDAYLNMAGHIADYWLNHPELPEDGVPYWDFNAKDINRHPEWSYRPEQFRNIPRDASAAAITASALIELSTFVTDKSKAEKYYDAAVKILKNLNVAYRANKEEDPFFILAHSVGSIPHGTEIDVPLVYADYYYLEALSRLKD